LNIGPGDKVPTAPQGEIKGTYDGSYEGVSPHLRRWLFLLAISAYIVPVMAVMAVLVGSGIGIGFLIWGQ
jgi:hypothetical protein